MPEAADRTIKLGDILSPAQCNEVALIFKTSAGSTERVKRLKDYFRTFADDLERQDILPDYLAYAVEYQMSQQR